MSLNLPGKITISRRSSTTGPPCVAIEITDAISHVTFCSGEMTLTDFASAITGHGYMPIALELVGLDVLGMKVEHKVELVEWGGRRFSETPEANQEEAKAAIAPLEVDGWKGRWTDLFNGNNRVQGKRDTFRVSFHRYVPLEEGAASVEPGQ